jgi:hypothetical protein
LGAQGVEVAGPALFGAAEPGFPAEEEDAPVARREQVGDGLERAAPSYSTTVTGTPGGSGGRPTSTRRDPAASRARV